MNQKDPKARLMFVGSTKRGYQALLTCLREPLIDVVGLLSLRQHPHESENYESHFAQLASEHKIPMHVLTQIKTEEILPWIQEQIRPDIILAIGARVLLPHSICQTAPLGAWGVHDSLLPKYRGFAPLNWAIINGERQTGVTLFELAEGMDSGDIIDQIKVPIGPEDDAGLIYSRICEATNQLLSQHLSSMAQGKNPRIPQNHELATYTCSRTPEDGLIHWNNNTDDIYNLIRALSQPFPGAFTFYKGERFRIWQASTRSPFAQQRFVGRIPGRVICVDRDEGSVDVLTGDGVLKLHKIQGENHSDPISPAEVIRSIRDRLG